MFTENKLFATLDPVSRGIILPDGRKVLLTDTVGFINKLPHDLVDAFQSTLEEVAEADLLLHVVDAGSPNLIEQMQTVDRVLDNLGAKQTIVTVYNKMDTIKEADLLPMKRPQVFISALMGQGLDELLAAIQDHLPLDLRRVKLLLPYDKGSLVSEIHEQGYVIREDYKSEGVEIEADLDELLYSRVKSFIKDD